MLLGNGTDLPLTGAEGQRIDHLFALNTVRDGKAADRPAPRTTFPLWTRDINEAERVPKHQREAHWYLARLYMTESSALSD